MAKYTFENTLMYFYIKISGSTTRTSDFYFLKP